MTQEDKAKAYDEALKVIKDNLDALDEIAETGAKTVNIQTIKNCFHRAFPELAETEDERIRKELIENLRELSKMYDTLQTEREYSKVQSWIAWLEKQGNQKQDPCENCMVQDSSAKRCTHWLKSLKYRVGCEANCTTTKECGEEDEVILDEIIDFFENGTVKLQHDLSLYAAWLKSLKDRVLPQPKQEWSEEDENLLKLSFENLTELKDRYGEEYGKVGNCISWLNSLKQRYTWKPSDEQINAIRLARSFVTDDFGANPTLSDTLKELEEQLKKLK